MKNKNKINLVIETGKVWNFSDLPEKSVALDGAVRGPKIDNKRKVYSFDHHENCIRHISAATCVQILDALLLGFNPSGFNVYINDVDADTLLSVYLLMNPKMAKNKFVQDIVRNVGIIDAHGSFYPLQKRIRKKLTSFNNYVMHNLYHNFYNHLYHLKNEKFAMAEQKLLIEESLEKVNNFFTKKLTIEIIEDPLPTYKVTPETNAEWVMVRAHADIFSTLYKSGFDKVVIWEYLSDQSISYTIAKKSEFVDFPVKEIIEELNKIENGWGGGSTIGGAPRNEDGSRSRIKPEDIVDIVNEIIKTC